MRWALCKCNGSRGVMLDSLVERRVVGPCMYFQFDVKKASIVSLLIEDYWRYRVCNRFLLTASRSVSSRQQSTAENQPAKTKRRHNSRRCYFCLFNSSSMVRCITLAPFHQHSVISTSSVDSHLFRRRISSIMATCIVHNSRLLLSLCASNSNQSVGVPSAHFRELRFWLITSNEVISHLSGNKQL